MVMNEIELKKLHDVVSTKFDVGDFESFKLKMNTVESRKKFFDLMGSKNFDLGVYEDYEKRLSSKTNKPVEDTKKKTDNTQNTKTNKTENKTSNTGGGEYQPLESGAYTTKGDPYQYKVVNGQWHTKSWKNRGKIIPNWTSLANNQTATSILDNRHPGVRVGKQGNEKSAQYAKDFSKDGKFGKELERLQSLGIKTSEFSPSDFRKYLTNPATNTADSTATSAKPTVDIKPVEPGISGPLNTINPADQNF